mmetsp:Transcript_82865/g.160148  ORF Transcript_82865/g.160148 Transcript_82865/m.160148 type:complete len:165 (-) Transcript_82865:401-895(-)
MVPSDTHRHEATMPPAFAQLVGGKEPVRRQVVNSREIELHFPVCFTESSNVCAICLSEIGASDPCRRTTCKHEFHADCITKWWTKRRGKPLNCPVCREIQKVSVHRAKQVRRNVQQKENFSKTFASVPHALQRSFERMYREGSATETRSQESSQMLPNVEAVQH